MLYRYGPSLSEPQWTWLFPGNVIAAISWLILSAVFSWYIGHFGNYDATYGSLGAAIGMMTWMWMSMIVVLLGAELNAEIQRKTNPAPADREPRLRPTARQSQNRLPAIRTAISSRCQCEVGR
jgi:membrane protein